LAGCCEHGDEALGSGATELVLFEDVFRCWHPNYSKNRPSRHFDKNKESCIAIYNLPVIMKKTRLIK
jgi:hypothetical protein